MAMCLILFWLGCGLAASSTAAESVTIVTASGQTFGESTLRDWTRDGIAIDSDAPREFPIDEVLSLQFARTAMSMASGDPLVILASGDRCVLHPEEVIDDVLTATWRRGPIRPSVKLPLETVSAIIFDMPTSMTDRQRLFADLQTLPAGNDVLLLANGDRVLGDLQRMDAESVQWKATSGVLKLDRKRIRAVRMNPDLINPPRPSDRRLILTLVDGSRITVQSAELTGRDVKCRTSSKLDLALPISSIVSCRIYGKRVVPLSDREPAQVQFVPFLSAQWPLVRNANVLRGPLAVRGVEYGMGLGMHSRTLATYALSGNDQEFRAVVGVDDCAAGAGSVRFAVELDDRRVWESSELTGRSPALSVPPIKLAGAKRLTLIVDYGKNADVSDYADWCDAVLIMGSNP